ncbi:MAG TPA: cytochrome c-type biogenesis CcmF C-terminal domain-containing protein, partial [Burkholderiales bacterium]|nr:cytochrome c-type biogenesis CcmF C-terminal domain-containing protein [Burkholderiales bacterium]
VENASFMPWLVGTALIHSLAVTEKRGAFRSWTVLLAIAAFALSLLGTFLVRSGVLTSVHAFAVDPERGVFILALFVVFIGGALALYAWRTARIGLGGAFAPVSRESFLLANNVVLAAAAGSVFLGTLYPLALDAVGGGKISVGPPYFETVFVPLMVPALFLMGIGPLARWKRASLPELAVLLRWALAASLVTGFLLPLALGTWKPMVGFGLALALFIVASTLISYKRRWRQTRAFHGMALAHAGVAAFVVGVTLVKGYEVEKDLAMKEGDAVELAGYRFTLQDVSPVNGPNYKAARATIAVTADGRPVRTLHPEKRVYTVQEMPMTEAAIDTGPLRDLYVSLGDPVEGNAWLVRVHYKPFISWIWAGCLLMALGGFVAASDRRYRVSKAREEKQAVQTA